MKRQPSRICGTLGDCLEFIYSSNYNVDLYLGKCDGSYLAFENGPDNKELDGYEFVKRKYCTGVCGWKNQQTFDCYVYLHNINNREADSHHDLSKMGDKVARKREVNYNDQVRELAGLIRVYVFDLCRKLRDVGEFGLNVEIGHSFFHSVEWNELAELYLDPKERDVGL